MTEAPDTGNGKYSSEKSRRMEEIRARYDPQGVFFGFSGLTR